MVLLQVSQGHDADTQALVHPGLLLSSIQVLAASFCRNKKPLITGVCMVIRTQWYPRRYRAEPS